MKYANKQRMRRNGMKYAAKERIVEAFRIGIDNIPDWFMDEITKNKATLKTDESQRTYVILHLGHHEIETVHYGDYIVKTPDGRIYSLCASYFEDYYVEFPEDEPLNAVDAEPPEMERLKVLQEYYGSVAKEIKLAHSSLISVGFKEDDAFLILLRMMENPIEPAKKKSREELELTMARLRAERKAKKDVEELVNRANKGKERVSND